MVGAQGFGGGLEEGAHRRGRYGEAVAAVDDFEAMVGAFELDGAVGDDDSVLIFEDGEEHFVAHALFAGVPVDVEVAGVAALGSVF
jgi:hypothetical protein